MKPCIEIISVIGGHRIAEFFRHTVHSILLLAILGLAMSGCSDEDLAEPVGNATTVAVMEPEMDEREILAFDIEPKYSYIRSCPDGGGVFVLRIAPGSLPPGPVRTRIKAPEALNALIAVDGFNEKPGVSEIVINPDQSMAPGVYEIIVYATESGFTRSRALEVDLINRDGILSEMAVAKRDDFIGWLEEEHPELGTFSDREWFSYPTYPGILVVEHWTFLDDDWEMRICFHVMIPPYDWSMLMLRERGEWNPILAAKRDSDAPIYEIPVDEYPIMFGY
jgi:hypothetical protein